MISSEKEGKMPGPLTTGVPGVPGVQPQKCVGSLEHIYMCEVFLRVPHVRSTPSPAWGIR